MGCTKMLQLWLLVLSVVLSVTGYNKMSIECDKAKWQEGSIAYIGTSTFPLGYMDIFSDVTSFIDATITDDYGVVCDAAAYFYDPKESKLRFLTSRDQFSWSDIGPETSMLNITCQNDELRTEIKEKNIAKDFSSLKSLALRCKLRNIERKHLGPGSNLRVLDLSNNDLTSLDKDIFRDHYYLMVLTLNNNRFVTLSPTLFNEATMIFSLNMINSFSSFPTEFLSPNDTSLKIPNLEMARLFSNNFPEVPTDAFGLLREMSDELVLTSCNISSIQPGAFASLPKMKFLFMNKNKLRTLPDSLFNHTNDIHNILIQENELEVLNAEVYSGLTLKYMNASWNNIQKITGEFSKNTPEMNKLFLQHNRLTVIENGTFSYLPRFEKLNLAYNYISEIEAGSFAGLVELKTLVLSYNQLNYLPGNMLANCTSLELLDLHGNKLFDIGAIFAKPAVKLQNMDLRDNQLRHVSENVIQNLIKSINLELSGNPWNCSSCKIMPLVNFTRNMTSPSADIAKCLSTGENITNISLDCQDPSEPVETYLTLVIWLAVALAVVVIVLLACVCVYRKRVEIQVLVYVKYGKKWKSDKPESIDDFEYDAFVSFNSHLNHFVIQDLMPKLEKEWGYKLCLHFRDFELGGTIVRNIVNSIEKSRKIILLVSRQFMESEWCKYEYQLAHHAVMSEKTNRVIMILMDDVKTLPLDQTMKSYIKTHTYLAKSDSLFIERLLYAMPDVPLSKLKKTSSESLYSKYAMKFVAPDDSEDDGSELNEDCDEVNDCRQNDEVKAERSSLIKAVNLADQVSNCETEKDKFILENV